MCTNLGGKVKQNIRMYMNCKGNDTLPVMGDIGGNPISTYFMPRHSPSVKVAKVRVPSDNRITLHKPFCDALPWLAGKSETDAWLYLVEPGRYRLLSDADVESDPYLRPVRAAVLQGNANVNTAPSQAADMREAAMPIRLVPITIEFHSGSYRTQVAEELVVLAPRYCDPRDLSILMPEGYLEIWYTDALLKATDRTWRSS